MLELQQGAFTAPKGPLLGNGPLLITNGCCAGAITAGFACGVAGLAGGLGLGTTIGGGLRPTPLFEPLVDLVFAARSAFSRACCSACC